MNDNTLTLLKSELHRLRTNPRIPTQQIPNFMLIYMEELMAEEETLLNSEAYIFLNEWAETFEHTEGQVYEPNFKYPKIVITPYSHYYQFSDGSVVVVEYDGVMTPLRDVGDIKEML